VREGFDPARIADPLFVFDRTNDAYVPLDRDCYSAIEHGSIRL
jgi:fatty-acyl-CoA synthase